MMPSLVPAASAISDAVRLPPPPLDRGAIAYQRLNKTDYRQVFHRKLGASPLRLERILRWDPLNESWIVVRESEMAANRILVKADPHAPRMLPQSYELKSRGPAVHGSWICFEFAYESSEDRLGQLLEELEALGHSVEPDYLVEVSGLFSGDPLFQAGKQPYLDSMASFVEGSLGAATLWQAQTDASAATVAILDTGLHLSHEEFVGQLWLNEGEIPGNGIDNDGNGWVDDVHGYNFVDNNASLWDDHGHGTHVAGLIGAAGDNGLGMAGIAWRSRLMPIKVLNAGGNGFVSDVVNGIYYAINNGADVMLLAWQTGADSGALRDALEAAQVAGLSWSVPAGNQSRSLDEVPQYPAAYLFENQITVASHDLNGMLSNFSNYGISHVAVSAPGNDLLSTGNAHNGAYERRTGTSQASALVAGLLAHLKTAHPDEPGWRLIQRIKQSATQRPRENHYLHSGNRDYVGAGRVDLASPALLATSTAPANNALKDARRFEKPSFFQREVMLDATAEPGEPAHGGSPAESSLWYEWKPRVAGTGSLRAEHSAASLAVYRWGGTMDLLAPVASAAPAEGGASLEFQVLPGTTYFCAVNVPAGTSEPVRTDFRLLPDNQSFTTANGFHTELFASSTHVQAALSTDGVGGSPNEAWHRWTAPADGILRLNARAQMDARFTMFRVNEAGELGQEVGSIDLRGLGSRSKQQNFNTVADADYAFRWQSLLGGNGYVTFAGVYKSAPIEVSIFTYGTTSPLWGTQYRIGSSLISGTAPFSYRWYRDGKLIQNGSWCYFTPNIDFSHVGTYQLVVSNELGTAVSNTLDISVRALPPTVRITPDAAKLAEGANASFYANVSGSLGTPVAIEWFLNGEQLPASTLTLKLENLTLADSGILQVRATNRFGANWSQEVVLLITENSLTDWKRVMPNTAGFNLQSVMATGNRYYARTPGMTLYTSTDGVNWNEAVFDRSFDTLGSIAYGNNIYMAVAQRGRTPIVLVSDDGIFWETVYEAPGGSYGFAGLTFGNGRFVTRRNINWSSSTMHVSTDGRNWQTGELGTTIYGGTLFGNGIFLISHNGTHFVSSDGLNWTAHAIAEGGPTRTGSMTYHDGYFYKLSGSLFSNMGLFRSTNGIDWEVVSPPGSKGGIRDTDGLYYDGEYFMVPQTLGIYYSQTGDYFLRHSGNETGDSQQGSIKDIALLGDEMVGIDDNGRIIHGKTLKDLVFDEPIFTRDIHRMESLDSVLVVMGNTGSADAPLGIAWTHDGVSWEINERPRVRDIVEWNNRFYAIGAPSSGTGGTALIVSADLRQWSFGASLPGQGNLIEVGNGRLVVVLDDGRVTTSVDGVNWTAAQATNGQTTAVNEMRFLNGEFWLARESGLHRSADGELWQAVALSGIKDLTYASGKYIATPYLSGVLYESPDGEVWTEVAPGGNITAKRLKTDGTSVYGALNRALLYSKELTEWTLIPLAASSSDVAFFNASVFYCGNDGLVYRHGAPVAAPSLTADIFKQLRSEPIDVGSTISFDYTVDSARGSVTVSLIVDGQIVDQVMDESPLSWTPEGAGIHQIQLRAADSEGLTSWTDALEIHVKGAGTQFVSSPAELKVKGLLTRENAAWITMENGDIYYRPDPTSKWIRLDAWEAVDGFNGAYKDADGHLYAFGWVIDAFDQSRGIVLRSNEGQVWERFGELLPKPVIDVLMTQVGDNEVEERTFYALSLDPYLTTASAPSEFHYRSGDAPWTQVSGVDTLRGIAEWQDRLYAKDRAGNVLVSSNGLEWSLEFDTAFDTRQYRLEATDDMLLLLGRRPYHNRVNGNSWGYVSSANRALLFEGIAYIESNEGVFELTPQGLLLPSARFETLYSGLFSLGSPVQVEAGDGWSLWRTDADKILASETINPGSVLQQTDFSDNAITLLEGLPFRQNESGSLVPLNAPEGWSSASLSAVATQAGLRDFIIGDGTALFVGTDGLYRHNTSDDTWTLIRSVNDRYALAHSQGRFWLGGSGVFEYSDDGGDTWISLYDDLYALAGNSLAIRQIIADGDRVAVNAASRNILFSADGGSSWVNTGWRANRIAFTPTALIFAGDSYSNLAKKEASQEFIESERVPFGLPSSYFAGHSWSVRDYLWQDGTEYLVLATHAMGALLQRAPGSDWQVLEFPRSIPSGQTYLASSGSKTFWVSGLGVSQIVLHNLKTSLVLAPIDDLGVGDSFEAVFGIYNQGVGLSPGTSFTIKAFLQPSADTLISDAFPIGTYRAVIPPLFEGESHDLQMNLQIPNYVSPGNYHLRLAAIGMRDTRSRDNSAVSENPYIRIPSRTVDIQTSGRGSVTILDSRSEYPDKFALPIQINPDPGYVYSFGGDGPGDVNTSGLQTLILDQSFSGSVYFEPSFATWAAEQIPVSESRSRSGIAYGGVPNIFKYVFGYAPTETGRTTPLTIFEDNFDGSRSVAFDIVRGREHESPALMISDDLIRWNKLQTEATAKGNRIRFDAAVPSAYSDRAFFQLSAD